MPDFHQILQDKETVKMVHPKEQSESSETGPKETPVLSLFDKVFKTTIFNMITKIKENTDK